MVSRFLTAKVLLAHNQILLPNKVYSTLASFGEAALGRANEHLGVVEERQR